MRGCGLDSGTAGERGRVECYVACEGADGGEEALEEDGV